VGITAGSREIPGRKGLRQETSISYNDDDDDDDDNNNNNSIIKITIINRTRTRTTTTKTAKDIATYEIGVQLMLHNVGP